MPSLTPIQRSGEISWAAMKDGLISGALTLIPSYGSLKLAMRNQKFLKATNWQSRTALVIMPALFMFGYTAELQLDHRMQEIAAESEHNKTTVTWANKKQEEAEQAVLKSRNNNTNTKTPGTTEGQLTALYRESVMNSGVRVVAGDRLGIHHQAANYWQEHPFKILAGVSIPAVGYIFYGRSGQQHLQLQSKLMHTRVFGQFAVITMLLSLMGFKEYMDRNGKFITELEANRRVHQMHQMREELFAKMAGDKKQKEMMAQQLKEAHQKDIVVKTGNTIRVNQLVQA